MAVTSSVRPSVSGSEQVLSPVLDQLPLHAQNDSSSHFTSCVACNTDDIPDLVESECNACPHCADQCDSPNCVKCRSGQSARKTNGAFLCEEQCFTMCQLARHNHNKSCWLLVGDSIYDVTSYVAKHPGGINSIVNKSGGKADCTVDFQFHSKAARTMWKQYKVGKLLPCPSQRTSTFGTDEQCVIS